MRRLIRCVPVALFGLCLGLATPCDADKLCLAHGRVAFVQYRNQADVTVRFVNFGHDTRIRFRRFPNSNGEWLVVGRNDNPDLKIFVQSYGGSNVVDVKIVDTNPGC